MRRIIIAGNWKMQTTPAEAGELAREIGARTRVDGVVRVLCPPYVSIGAVRDAAAGAGADAPDGAGLQVGAQNIHHEASGAHTGEVSAPMLVGLADWVIVGHSERRRDAGETDTQIAAKLLRAWEAGLRPILCVGEVLEDREAGRADAVVGQQVCGALTGADVPAWDTADPTSLPWLTIAYEPVWAIGTGRNARGSDAASMAETIRRTLDGLGIEGSTIPILYGGSVTSANIDEFMVEQGIDGALVGGASLKVDEMAAIVARAGITAAARLSHGAGTPAAPGERHRVE
ncbi:MAG: triose-phosphate isomerase [Chloroflexota bacterium]